MAYFQGMWNKTRGEKQREVYLLAYIISKLILSFFHILHTTDMDENGATN